MTSAAPAVPFAGSADQSPVAGFVRQSAAIAEAELRKLARDPTELLTRAVQPALWLIVFGEVFTRIRAIPTGNLSYLEFMAPGVLAQSVLFISIFFGIAAIWERDLGIVHKLLVSPAYRGALVTGKALSAGLRALSQAVIIYVLALVMGIHLQFGPLALLGVAAIVMLGAALFATFSLCVACIVKTRERFMGIGQVLTMPIFFASNAIYPLALMPGWLKAVSSINPLTYEVDGLRALMIQGGTSVYGLPLDIAVLCGITAVLVVIAARMYPRMAV